MPNGYRGGVELTEGSIRIFRQGGNVALRADLNSTIDLQFNGVAQFQNGSYNLIIENQGLNGLNQAKINVKAE